MHIGQHAGQVQGADIHQVADHHLAADLAARGVDRVDDLAAGPQHGPGRFDHGAAGLGQLECARGPVEQPDAEFALELGDARGHRGLHQVQRSGRRGEGSEIAAGQEAFDLTQFHDRESSGGIYSIDGAIETHRFH